MKLNFWKKGQPKEAPQVKVIKASKPAKIYVGAPGGMLLPWGKLEKSRIAKSSKQIQEDKRWVTSQNLIPKKYPPASLIRLVESQALLSGIITQISEDVVNDHKLILREGEKENEKERKELEAFLGNVNPDYSLKELLTRCVVDSLITGAWNVECVRNIGGVGKVCELWHVRDSTVYAHRDGKLLAQQINNKTRWFTFYNPDFDKVLNVSMETGEEGDWDIDSRAGEMARYVKYSPAENPKYGLSQELVSATRNILTILESTDFSLQAYTERCLPEFLITLKGDFDEGVESTIQGFLRDLKGDNRRSMVVTLGEDQEIHFDPIKAEVKEDRFTLQLLELNEQTLMSSFRIPASRLGVMKGTRSVSGSLWNEQNKVYWESNLRPKQIILEQFMDKIIQGVLGRESVYCFTLKDLDIQNRSEQSKILETYFGMSIYSVNDVRVKLGLERIEGLDNRYISTKYVPVTELELKKRKEEIAKGEAEMDTFFFELETLRREIKKAKQN